jgi:hypothetical protein
MRGWRGVRKSAVTLTHTALAARLEASSRRSEAALPRAKLIRMLPAECGFPRILALKLSEKGLE